VCDYRCTSVSFIKLSNRIESNYFSPNRNAPLHMCFKFDKIRFVGYGVIAEKPRVGYLPRFLSVHPVEKKTCLGSKNDWHFLEWSRRPLSPCTVWGDRTTSVVVCFFCFVFLTRSGLPARCSFEGDSLSKHCVTVYGSILMLFSALFQKKTALSEGQVSSLSISRWRHNFREIAVESCENSRNWRKKFVRTQLRIDSRKISIKFHGGTTLVYFI